MLDKLGHGIRRSFGIPPGLYTEVRQVISIEVDDKVDEIAYNITYALFDDHIIPLLEHDLAEKLKND